MKEKVIKYLDYGYNLFAIIFVIYVINKYLEIINLDPFQWLASLIPTLFCTILLTRYILTMKPDTPYKKIKQIISISAILFILVTTSINVYNVIM